MNTARTAIPRATTWSAIRIRTTTNYIQAAKTAKSTSEHVIQPGNQISVSTKSLLLAVPTSLELTSIISTILLTTAAFAKSTKCLRLRATLTISSSAKTVRRANKNTGRLTRHFVNRLVNRNNATCTATHIINATVSLGFIPKKSFSTVNYIQSRDKWIWSLTRYPGTNRLP